MQIGTKYIVGGYTLELFNTGEKDETGRPFVIYNCITPKGDPAYKWARYLLSAPTDDPTGPEALLEVMDRVSELTDSDPGYCLIDGSELPAINLDDPDSVEAFDFGWEFQDPTLL